MKLINLILCLLILISCNKNKTKFTLEDLNKINPNTEYSLDSIVSKMEIVPLETSDSCLIGENISIRESKDYYFIQSINNESLYKFDKKGKFISKIGIQGQGPAEYVSLYQVELDEKNNLVYILDYFGQKLLSYTFDGVYVNSYKVPSDHSFTNIKPFNDKIYYFSVNNAVIPDVLCFDPNKNEYKIISKGERSMSEGEGYMGDNLIYTQNKKLYLYHYFNDTIYNIDDNKLIKADLLPLGKNRFTFEDIKNELNNNRSHKSKIQFDGIVSLPDYTFIFYVVTNFKGNNRTNLMAMYSEHTKNFYHHVNLVSKKYIPIIDGARFSSNNNSTLIRIIKPTDIDNDILNKYKIDVEDNPVLFIYHIK